MTQDFDNILDFLTFIGVIVGFLTICTFAAVGWESLKKMGEEADEKAAIENKLRSLDFILFQYAFATTEKEEEEEEEKICETAKGYESNYEYCDKLLDKEKEQPYPEGYYDNEGYPFVKCPNDTNTYPKDTKCYDATLAEPNISKMLKLKIDYNQELFDISQLEKDGYYLKLKVKSDWYTDYEKIPFSNLHNQDNMIYVPIINNDSNKDDGGDFRIDVWVNQYDRHYLKANYPISRNATFDSVNITDILSYVVEDNRREAIEAADEADDEDDYN